MKGDLMGLFAKRRAEKEEEARQIREAQASRKLYDEVVRPGFRDQFLGWLNRLEQARAESEALVLTDELLEIAGGAPQLEGDGLTRSHAREFVAYAKSYTGTVLQDKFANNSQFWRSVASYTAQIYG